MPQGWIKLHRQLLEKGYANKPAYVSLWVHLLLMANHRDKEVMWNGELISIKQGQFITGRKTLAEKTGIAQSTIEDILKVFESSFQIRQQKTSKHRLIIILNWDKHQISDNKATTGRHKQEGKKGKITSETKVSADDMIWNKQAEDYEVGTVDLDGNGSLAVEKKKDARKYPNAPAVRKVFQEVLGKNPANWRMNATQLKACENLYTERTVEKVRSALEFIKENEEKEYCPKISSPYDLDSKWTKLGEFKLKQS